MSFRLIRNILSICLSGAAATLGAAGLKMECEPYLRYINNQTAAVTFIMAAEKPTECYVEFSSPQRPQSRIKMQSQSVAPGKWVYNAEIKDLAAGSNCTYALVAANGDRSGEYKFSMPGRDQIEHTILLISDVHERSKVMGQMIRSGRKAGASLCVLLGDQVGRFEDDSYNTMMNGFLSELCKQAQGTLPVTVLRGNHDYYGKNHPIWHKFFPCENNRTYFSLRKGNVFYIFLDSGNAYQPEMCRRLFAHQRKWLEAELQSEACRTATFRVVVVHYPSHAIAESVAKVTPGPLLKGLLTGTDPDKRIHLMLSGHRHRYIRTDAFSNKFKVNSSGFSNKTPGLPGVPGKNYPYTLVIADSFNHGGSADFNYFLVNASADRLHVQSLDEKNRKIDEFTIAPDGKVTDMILVKEFTN